MKILILSMSPLRMDNTVGNTYANIFDNMDNVEFASIYCKSGKPNVNFVNKYFRITEAELIKNLKNKNYRVGKVVKKEDDTEQILEKRTYYIARMFRFKIFFWLRDLIWKVGRWKSEALDKFIEEFKPDVIFAPLDNNHTLNEVIQYVHRKAQCKLAVYAWDDIYTLNQFSVSPFFWIDRFYQRGAIKNTVKESDKVYVISELQKQVYDKCFDIDSDILFKGYDFEDRPQYEMNKTIKILFTGNLGYKRWEQLIKLAMVLNMINADGIKAQLYIYSKTALRKSIINQLNLEKSSFFMGAVSHTDAMRLQEEADILLHVESFVKKYNKLVRLSFSTKLVDYFKKAKCIFAIGPKDVASIDYLVKNDAAVAAVNSKEIETKLVELINNKHMIHEYAYKSWECGKKNHQINEIQNKLYRDLEGIVNENSTN